MQATHCPLTGPLKAASNTLTTGKLHIADYPPLVPRNKLDRTIRHADSGHGVVTGHSITAASRPA